MPPFKDLTGQRIGRWTVLRRDGVYKHGGAQWLCRCECGNEKTVGAQALASGQSQSCGCLNADVHREVCVERNTTHGHSKRGERSSTYRVWMNLSSRKFHEKYDGITICDRWKSFENFLEDMGERPSELHTIDRKDNSKGYEPSNCRWATMEQQQNNRTNNRLITFQGRTQTLARWSKQTGIKRETIFRRIENGWTPHEALTLRPRVGRNQYDRRV